MVFGGFWWRDSAGKHTPQHCFYSAPVALRTAEQLGSRSGDAGHTEKSSVYCTHVLVKNTLSGGGFLGCPLPCMVLPSTVNTFQTANKIYASLNYSEWIQKRHSEINYFLFQFLRNRI